MFKVPKIKIQRFILKLGVTKKTLREQTWRRNKLQNLLLQYQNQNNLSLRRSRI